MTTAPAVPATAPTRIPDRAAPPADAGPWTGRPIDRSDGTAKVTGTAMYSAEYQVPDIAHAVLVHATIARGRIRSIDTALADAHPGVVAVLTHRNAPKLAPPPSRVNLMDLSSMAAGSRVPYLNTDEVFYDGQPVAVVVADRLEAAQYAASLVDIDYEPLPAHVDFATEQSRATPVKQSLGMPTLVGRKGDAAAALASAPRRVDMRFTTPSQNHNAMEPHSTTAVWDGDQLTVWDSSQNIDWVRKHLALRFGVPAEHVRVVAPFVGGGFGGKSFVWSGTLLTVMAARTTGRPVRLALTREGVHRTVGGRSPTTQRVALGATPDGRLAALVHEAVMRTSPMGGSADQVVGATGDLYDAQTIAVHSSVVELDLVPNTAMRAPGESVGSFALESAMDQLANDLGLDPVDLRLRNEPDVSPIHGKAFSHRRIRQAMELGAREFGWYERQSTHTGSMLVGYGMALAYHPSWVFTANLTLSLDAEGTATLRCGFHEIGTGTGTVLSQVVADELGVPFDAVRVEYGDTELPIAPGAGGSAQSASVVGSIAAAAGRIRKQVQRWGGREGEKLADALRRTGHDRVEVSVGADSGVRAMAGQARFLVQTFLDQRRWVRAASGAHFCEVHVDRDTGEVRVARWLAAFDVGRVLNAKTLASQLRGGIVMGLGLALTEETVIDPRTGRIMSASLADYHVPVHADVPDIAIHVLDDPDPSMPKGVLGAGEVGITGVGAAVANAVYDATGVRVTDLPITLDKVVGGR